MNFDNEPKRKDSKQSNLPLSLTVDTQDLSNSAVKLINQIIAENDEEKTKDLTYLFNQNQVKKNIVRQNKLQDLLDTITDQAIVRFSSKPDEITNKELMDGLKIVNDLLVRGQDQINGQDEAPLIQINQQTNSVNVDGSSDTLNRDSREKVKNAVLAILNSVNTTPKSNSNSISEEPPVVEAEIVEDNQEIIDMAPENEE